MYKKNVLQVPGPNTYTAVAIRKEVLTPHPHRKKKVPRCGGQNPKNHWGIIFDPKLMILQKVRPLKTYLGVWYANEPEK